MTAMDRLLAGRIAEELIYGDALVSTRSKGECVLYMDMTTVEQCLVRIRRKFLFCSTKQTRVNPNRILITYEIMKYKLSLWTATHFAPFFL